MIALKFRGEIKELIFQSEVSTKFIFIEESGSRLLCTLTKKYLNYSDLIVKGKKFEITGELSLYEKSRDQKIYRDNTFYVHNIEELKNN